MKKIIKRFIPDFVYRNLRWLKYYLYARNILSEVKQFKKSKDNALFLLFTPEHKNIGDHAIAFAEHLLLKDYSVFEITGAELLILSNYPHILRKIFCNDTLIFQGGGYLGTIWFDAELLIRKTFSAVGQNNRMIVFPQTIYYEDSEWGKEEFERSKEIYNNCPNIVFTAREKASYEIMKDAYKQVYLIPDVVLSLNNLQCSKDKPERSGVSVCFRNDVEKTMSDHYKNSIISLCSTVFDDNIKYFDMCADYDIKPVNREKALTAQFDKFLSSELVITDRLHGMIFAAITGTPCIVVDSKSPKVKGVYDWIFKDSEYITFTNDFQEMEDFIRNTRGNTYSYDNSEIKHYYDELLNIVKEVNFGK